MTIILCIGTDEQYLLHYKTVYKINITGVQ